jgi:nucleoside-diphosphate-sugar epimerase
MVETLLFLNEQKLSSAKCKVVACVRDIEKAKKRFIDYGNRSDLAITQIDLASPLRFDEPVHYIVHGASPASPKFYSKNPHDLYVTNVLGTHHLLQVAREHNVEGFLLFSTNEVYGRVDASQLPVKESSFGGIDPTLLRSSYAESKRIAENMCASAFAQFGTKTTIVRPCHTFGPYLSLEDGRVFADFVACILRKTPITLKSDGKPLRTFCYLADATQAFFYVMLTGEPGNAYNVANSGTTTSIRALAEMLATQFGDGKVIMPEASELRKAVPAAEIWPDSTPDPAKVMALGWQPRTSLRDAFARTLASFGFEVSRV